MASFSSVERSWAFSTLHFLRLNHYVMRNLGYTELLLCTFVLFCQARLARAALSSTAVTLAQSNNLLGLVQVFTTGDVNNDGALDLVAANLTASNSRFSFVVLLNKNPAGGPASFNYSEAVWLFRSCF